MSAFTVVYDACVLYPAPLRDLLLQLAAAGLFRARWTDRIHDEWIENLLERRKDLTRDKLVRTRELMNASVLDCLVVGYESLEQAVVLPDPGDRHVVAAAIKCHADAIVTFNLKDFPVAALAPFEFMPYIPMISSIIKWICRAHSSAVRLRLAVNDFNRRPKQWMSICALWNSRNCSKRLQRCGSIAN